MAKNRTSHDHGDDAEHDDHFQQVKPARRRVLARDGWGWLFMASSDRIGGESCIYEGNARRTGNCREIRMVAGGISRQATWHP